mmetsp:Transcript_8972/g.21905  ORF Transcript_8972/g.21905 Transcript_8972/m.21905 type:complete len:115 (-) Transcript_8972:2059-2403(-)
MDSSCSAGGISDFPSFASRAAEPDSVPTPRKNSSTVSRQPRFDLSPCEPAKIGRPNRNGITVDLQESPMLYREAKRNRNRDLRIEHGSIRACSVDRGNKSAKPSLIVIERERFR